MTKLSCYLVGISTMSNTVWMCQPWVNCCSERSKGPNKVVSKEGNNNRAEA